MDTKKTQKEDINLMEIILLFISGIKKIFINLFNLIGGLLQLAYRHKTKFTILIILGGLSSLYFSQKSKRIYKVEAMIKLNGVDASTIKNIGKQLSLSSPVFESTSYESKLGISTDIAKRIKSLEFFPVIDFKRDSIPDIVDFKRKHSLEDTVNVIMDNYLYARLKIRKDVKDAEKIMFYIIDYFNSQKSVLNDFIIYKNNLEERINLCDTELKRLDSLANKSYFEKRQNQIKYEYNQLLVGSNKIQLFYDDQLELQKTKERTNEVLLKATAPTTLPSGVIINPRATNGRVKMGLLGIIAGFILAVIISLFTENRKKWLEYLNKK